MADRLSFTLHELVAELEAYADDVLRERYDVSFSHFQLLAVLADVEPADMTTLARCLGVTKAAVSKRVPALVGGGWVTARSVAGGGRSIHLSLTSRSAAVVRDAGAALDAEFNALLRDPAVAEDSIDPARLNRQLEALTAVVSKRSAERAATSEVPA